jgi:hypothetical protein
MKKKVLLAGESWVSAATHYKGFDQFGTTTFHLGAEPFVAALADSPYEIDYMPAHDCAEKFPLSVEGLGAYAAVILSDLGANTLLLHPEVWLHGRPVAEPASRDPRLCRGRRRAGDDRRLFQLSGHQRRGALGGHGGGGDAAGDLPPL